MLQFSDPAVEFKVMAHQLCERLRDNAGTKFKSALHIHSVTLGKSLNLCNDLFPHLSIRTMPSSWDCFETYGGSCKHSPSHGIWHRGRSGDGSWNCWDCHWS